MTVLFIKATFANYNIPAPLLERLNQLGYKNPFQIQTETLEHTLAGK
jgi:superfamily II DNA/RNA helicase